MYIDEPNAELHPNLIEKFEPELNLTLAKSKLESTLSIPSLKDTTSCLHQIYSIEVGNH